MSNAGIVFILLHLKLEDINNTMSFLNYKKSVFFCLLFFVSIISKGQLTTSSVMTPAQLVQNVLLGSGISATNITYAGAALARGTFNGAASNIGLTSGVLLCTGHVSNACGPNNNPSITNVNSLPGDADMNIITSPIITHDACILEFDFIPRSDTVKFRYVFASDEYMEYVNAPPLPPTYNDAFGFFISGPGISGPFNNNAKNIALVPGTTLPVTMYNLSLNSNSQYYFDNGDGNGTGTVPDGLTVQYDGFTIPLTAMSVVQCGQTYHIKIAIADAFDSADDSGVFLEAGSFSSPEQIQITSNTFMNNQPAINNTLIYEGCGKARLHFKRIGTACNLIYADTVYYTIGGTALNGADYSAIGDSIIFPANVDTASMLINVIPDLLTEGNETFILNIINSTPPASITLTISDSPPLTVNLNPDVTYSCPPSSMQLNAVTTGGTTATPLQYTWINANSTTDIATVNPQQTSTYYVTVTDACGNSATDSMHITVTAYTPMVLSVTPDTNICYGDALTLKANVSGGRPAYTFSWSPGNSSFDSLVVNPANTTTYTVSVTDQCSQTLSQPITVVTNFIQAGFHFNFTTNQNIQFNNVSAGATSYLWNFGDSSADSSSHTQNPVHYYSTDGTYLVSLVVTNAQGCKDSVFQTLVILPDFYFYFPNSFSPNDDGKNDIFTGYGIGLKSYRMTIYNRWGELIYISTDITKGWDGIYMSGEAPAGEYVCMFDLETFNNKEIRKIGNLNLIR